MIDRDELIKSWEIFRDKMISALPGKGERTMPDREKVIRAVESCFDYWLEQHRCLHPLELESVRELKVYALALLKEQEPVKPIIKPWITDDNGDAIVSLKKCGRCGWLFFTEKPKYCEECGTPIDWDYFVKGEF